MTGTNIIFNAAVSISVQFVYSYDKEHEDRGQGGGSPLNEDDVDKILSKRNRKSGLRERGASQAPPLKRRRERDRSAVNTNSERMERSLEVEREQH